MKRIIYDSPKWHVFQHRSSRGLPLAETNDGAKMRFEDELFDRIYSGEPDLLPEKQRSPELREWAEKVHGVCDQLPEFQRLSNYCRGDVDAAGLAVEELMTILESHMQLPPDAVQAPMLRKTINAACTKAEKKIDEQRDAVDALEQVGFGTKRGDPSKSMNPISARALAKRLKGDQRLARIAVLAGGSSESRRRSSRSR